VNIVNEGKRTASIEMEKGNRRKIVNVKHKEVRGMREKKSYRG